MYSMQWCQYTNIHLHLISVRPSTDAATLIAPISNLWINFDNNFPTIRMISYPHVWNVWILLSYKRFDTQSPSSFSGTWICNLMRQLMHRPEATLCQIYVCSGNASQIPLHYTYHIIISDGNDNFHAIFTRHQRDLLIEVVRFKV